MATLATSFGGPCGAGLKAGVDLSAAQCKWMKLSAGAVIPCVAGEASIGVLGDAPKLGEGCEILAERGRVVTVLVGAAGVTVDSEITPDATGASVNAAATNWVMARSLATAASGARVSALLTTGYIKA